MHLGDPPKLRLLDTRQMLETDPPPLDWLAEGIFCRGKLTLFGGREKRGKSLVQMVLAIAMASGGGMVADIPVKAGRVLIVDGENGEQELHRRLRAVGLALEDADQLVLVEARGFDLRENLDVVASFASNVEADLVVLDSFRALWRGDERAEEEVAAALDPLRQLAHDTDTAIVLTHHQQKGGDEYRGSSAIGACVDWCVMLDRHPEDGDKTRRRLANPLARVAPERPDRWVKIRSGGDDGPISLAVAEPFERRYEAPVRDEVGFDVEAFVRGCTGVGGSTNGDTCTTPSWSGAELARAVGRDKSDRTVRQALKRLADRGILYRDGDGRWHPGLRLFDDEEDER